ncbi:MAG: hypothetical protein KHX56_01555 [Clostridiales bacterium]|nr:hypothetical protein [Clostridiales bacterium]
MKNSIVISGVLAAALAVGTFSGCGNQGNNAGTETNSQPSDTQDAISENAEGSDGEAKEPDNNGELVTITAKTAK